MTATPEHQGSDPGRRRLIVIMAIVGMALIVILGLAAGWLFFFGSEAPEAPTLEDAIKVLMPSASPQ